MRRLVLMTCGFVAVGLGTVGIVVPGLPTTGFFVLAAACFAARAPGSSDGCSTCRASGRWCATTAPGWACPVGPRSSPSR